MRKEVRQLFEQHEKGEISLDVFKHKLIALAYEWADKGIWEKESVENVFIPDYIEPQFEAYRNGQTYLLSTTSSGSLLQQFYMAIEYSEEN